MERLEARTVLGPTPEAPTLLDIKVLRHVLLTGALVAALLALGVTLIHRRDQKRDLDISVAHAEGVAAVQSGILKHHVETLRGAVRFFAGEPTLIDFLSDHRQRPALEREWLRLLVSSSAYDQIRLLGPRGREIVRVDVGSEGPRVVPEEQLQAKASRYYFDRAWPLEAGEVYLSQLDLNIENGRLERPYHPMLRLATPVYDSDGEKFAILVVNYSGRHLLDRLRSSTSYAAGSTWLVDSKGYYLEGPRPADSWGFHLGLVPTFQRDFPDAWERIRAERRASFRSEGGYFASARVVGEKGKTSDLDLWVVCHVPYDVALATSSAALRRLVIGAGLIFLAALVAAMYASRTHEARVQDRARLAASEARLRSLAGRLLEVQEVERRKLSRDLHDELGQLATATTIHLNRALKVDSFEKKNERIAQALRTTDDLSQGVRSIATRLRSSLLDDIGLSEALALAAADLSERLGIDVRCDLDLEEGLLSEGMREHLYRIVQEALTNIARHAKTERAELEVSVSAAEARVCVRDDGAGFDTSADLSGRFGLLGMRERTEILGGTFHIDSRRGEGTRMEIRFPVGTKPGPQ